ncbi:MAG: alanine--tRNA ligase-related protein, partial [Candidatus Woesearchaeota archaeon]|nr:alanine--tRNA ligase-related protein [Candidatus Woesearchaeota archaeon]
MKTDKELKKEFKIEASKAPEKFYAVQHLKEEGFQRKQCKCGTFFWTVNDDQEVCGDPACSGGFKFIGKSPAKQELDYIQVWTKFAEHFKKQGYTPIKRYPVVARWRDDQYWVGASIYDFQPHVVSGAVEPPANPLVVPQFCLRFNDIDNVGITGAHYTGFVMIGQHMFVPEEKWDQNKVFSDIHLWLKNGLGLPNKEVTFHEDAWAGGGNLGPCMEYFSRGLELGNQVYMLYEQTPTGRKGLPLKVLDMGMGHERNAWFTKGTSTSYETTFPTVSKKLYKLTGIKPEGDLMRKFLPYSSYLNIDEVEDINKTWKEVAAKIDIDAAELKEKILPLSALYSVAEHTRSGLFAISDGALPNNVGGGYNLRVILRRAMDFIDKYGWDVSMQDIAEWHADYLKPLFPELSENMDSVKNILEVEKKKYSENKKKSKQIIVNLLEKDKEISEDKFLELYTSQGISPEMIFEHAKSIGKKIATPDDFYTK